MRIAGGLLVGICSVLVLASVFANHNRLVCSLKTQTVNELVLMQFEVSQLQSRQSPTSDAFDNLQVRGAAAETYLTALTMSGGRAQSYLGRLERINADIDALGHPSRPLTSEERRSLEVLRQNLEALTRDLHR